MEITSTAQGRKAEQIALNHILKHPGRLLYRNFRCKFGEIDLILENNNTIVFVEVRYRKNANTLDPAESIDVTKKRKIVKTALYFLQRNHRKFPVHDYRFDVVSITGQPDDCKINWIRNAFSA